MKTVIAALKNISNVNYAKLSADKKQLIVSIKPLTVTNFNCQFGKIKGGVASCLSFNTCRDTKVYTIITFDII